RHNACPSSPQYPYLCGIAKKAGREIHQHETHSLDVCAVVLSRESMSSFMKRSHGAEEEPEFDQVPARFRGEVVEGEAVRPDLAKAVGPHPSHQNEHGNADASEPRRKQEAQLGIKPGDVTVCIVPGFD